MPLNEPTPTSAARLGTALLCLSCSFAQAAGTEFRAGKGWAVFDSWEQGPLRVFYSVPTDAGAQTPILFVHHGRKRNADEYRDHWHDLALKYGFIVLAPEYPADHFPGEYGYDTGNIRVENGSLRPEPEWVFSAVEPMFDWFRGAFGSKREGYSMYGHSSGGGFVHRYVYFKPRARLEYAVAANPAWFTMPLYDKDFPFGLAGSGVLRADLAKMLTQRRLSVLAGEKDLAQRKQRLGRSEEANIQGAHVYARAHSYYFQARRMADRLGVDLAWRLEIIPEVGHNSAKIAPHAVRFLFDSADLKLAPGREKQAP